MITSTTPLKFMHVGFGNQICANKILMIIHTDSAQARRIKTDARKRNMYFDLTFGRATNSFVVMDDWTVFGCAFSAKALVNRFNRANMSAIAEELKLMEEVRAAGDGAEYTPREVIEEAELDMSSDVADGYGDEEYEDEYDDDEDEDEEED